MLPTPKITLPDPPPAGLPIRHENGRWPVIRDWLLLRGCTWVLVAAFMKTRLAQAALFIPTLGYALLWSKAVQDYAKLNDFLQPVAQLAPTERLALLHLGAIFLTIALVLYWWKCPDFLKSTRDLDDYLQRSVSIADEEDQKRTLHLLQIAINEDVVERRHVKEWNEALAPVTLQREFRAQTVLGLRPGSRDCAKTYKAMYYREIARHPIALFSCSAFIVLGLLAWLRPAAENLWLVATHVWPTLLGFG